MSNVSKTKKNLIEEFNKILDFDSKNEVVKKYQIIQNNILIILGNDATDESKEEYESHLIGKFYKKLLPKVKQGKLLNLPLINTIYIDNGIKIEL